MTYGGESTYVDKGYKENLVLYCEYTYTCCDDHIHSCDGICHPIRIRRRLADGFALTYVGHSQVRLVGPRSVSGWDKFGILSLG